MKQIEVDDELYHYIASRTQFIGESASDILRRLLRLPSSPQPFVLVQQGTIEGLKELATSKKQIKKDRTTEITQQLEKLLKSNEFKGQTKMVVRFLQVLSVLHRADPENFARATESVQGSERRYFAHNEQTILATGSGVKAKQIPDSSYWVITNNNTARKGLILIGVMEAMGVPQPLIEKIQKLFQ